MAVRKSQETAINFNSVSYAVEGMVEAMNEDHFS